MNFFEECVNMDMNHAGHHFIHDTEFNEGFFAASAYTGYAACCEGDYSLDSNLLNEVVDAALAAPGDEISLKDACYIARVDFNSLTHEDIQYIVKEFERRRKLKY